MLGDHDDQCILTALHGDSIVGAQVEDSISKCKRTYGSNANFWILAKEAIENDAREKVPKTVDSSKFDQIRWIVYFVNGFP